MKGRGWQIARAGNGLVLSRCGAFPAKGAGLWMETRFPPVRRPAVLAHEIRKDIWRALRRVRGFSPVVEIWPCREDKAGLCVRAGGFVSQNPPVVLHQRLGAVLQDATCRARWIAHAGKPPQ